MYTVYAREKCTLCKDVIRVLEEHKLAFYYYNFDSYKDKAKGYIPPTKIHTQLPIVFYKNSYVGGKQEFLEHFHNNLETKKLILKDMLRDNVCHIQFQKVDGTNRSGNITLRSDLIPGVVEDPVTFDVTITPKRTRPENPETLSVYDLDNSKWISFRIKNLITIALVEEVKYANRI